MPGAALHLTHIELLSRDPRVHTGLRRAMQREDLFMRFGAVLLDLPFYTSIVPMMLGYWLERPAEDCPFAVAEHRDRPDLFAWHLVRQAQRDARLTVDQRAALLAGVMAHMALDMELHPLVNRCARRDLARFGGNESHHHRLTEKYHSLFFHRDRLGRDPIGTWDFFRRKTVIVEHPPFVRLGSRLPVYAFISDLLRGFHGASAPSPRQVAHQVRCFRHFALMVCMPWARVNSRNKGTEQNRRRYYENDAFSFADYWERAFSRSVSLVNLAHESFLSGDLSGAGKRAFLAAAAISDLTGGRLAGPPGGDARRR